MLLIAALPWACSEYGIKQEAEAGEEEERDLATEDEEDGEHGEAVVAMEAGPPPVVPLRVRVSAGERGDKNGPPVLAKPGSHKTIAPCVFLEPGFRLKTGQPNSTKVALWSLEPG
jgi:hypothetical protein